MGLTFDEPSHTYHYEGRVVPSVTQVLGKLHDFSMVPKDVLAAACERGTIVHSLTEFHDQGDLDPSSIGDYWRYLDAWIAFRDDFGVEWDAVEERGYSERYGYAGTLDRRGRFTKRAPGKWIVDVKTSKQTHKVFGMQLAAYRQLVAERDPSWLLARRATVQLLSDGSYLFTEWADPLDWQAFLALIALVNWSTS